MEEANVNVDDVCTGNEDGGMTKTKDPRLMSIKDVMDTTSRDSVLATVRANEVVDDEAEVMVNIKADDRAREGDSPVRAAFFSKNDDGGGASIPDPMETYGERTEERSGKDVGVDLSAMIPTRLAKVGGDCLGMWGTLLADLVIQMLETDYARILRAIYAFAQIRITRRYRLPCK
ncbi:LOW QUALITY PROTEIN: hypothetical protein Bca4012_027152 [Brassica carinata]